MESFCRICGIIITDAQDGQKCCDNDYCKNEFGVFDDCGGDSVKTKTNLGSSRPWTSGCIDNLYKNMSAGWTAEKTAKETNRDIQDVENMIQVIEEKGFESLYYSLIEKEKAVRNKREQQSWFEKNGIV